MIWLAALAAPPASLVRKPSTGSSAPPIVRDILARTRTAGFQRYLRDLLVELCRIDTTPNAGRHADAGRRGRLLPHSRTGIGRPGLLRRAPRTPAHQSRHPGASELLPAAFHQDPGAAAGPLAGRNLRRPFQPALRRPRRASAARPGNPWPLNAHIDVVAPYFPPRVKGGTVYGRGACDDKGPAVSIVAALKVLSEVMPKAGLKWNRNVVAMLVVEEETGGNGSLSLALDRDLKKLYDSILVCECTDLKFYPANRGAVWYRADLKAPPEVSLFEMFAFVNEEMEKEGAAIRAESRHPLFPQRPVQTCHGIIGPFGEHPSRICGEVSFTIQFDRPPGKPTELLVRDCLEAGLASYIGLYGDKTKVTDPATGKPIVARHYDFRRAGRWLPGRGPRRDRSHGRHSRPRRRHHQNGPPGPQPRLL